MGKGDQLYGDGRKATLLVVSTLKSIELEIYSYMKLIQIL